MACVWSRSCCNLGLAGTLAIGGIIVGDRATAQLTPDSTLGQESSTVTQGVLIRGIGSDRIDGGALRGSNLFHSFLEFNVPAGQGVYFTNPVGVTNILTRVTGGTQSLIAGRLGVDGNANLYLLNPNGIVFGPGASLDVAGSFIASTADAIQVGNGRFSATDPANSTLLAVEPGALFLNALASQQSAITNQGNLTAGQNLTLVAGSVDSPGQLAASNGQINVRSVTGGVAIQTVTAQAIDLSSNSDLTVQNLTAPIASLRAGNDLQVADMTVQTATLNADNNLVLDNLTAQTATLRAGNNLQATNISAQTADLFASNNLAVTNLTAQGADLLAGNNLTVITLNAQTANLTALNDLTAQTVNAPNTFLTATRDLQVQTVNATDATLIATTGTLTVETVNALAQATLSAGSDLTVQTVVDAPIAVLSATGNLSAQTVNASTRATLTATRDFDVQTVIAPETALSANGNLTAQTVTATNAILSGGSLTLTGSQLSTTNNLTLQATVGDVAVQDSATNPFIAQVGGDLTITSNRDVSIQTLNHPNSLLQSDGNLTVSSNGNVFTSARLTSGADLSVTGNRLELTGSQFNATGNVELTAQTRLQAQDSLANPLIVSAGGTLAIQGSQGVDIQGLTNPGSLLQSVGDLTVVSERGTVSGSARFSSSADIIAVSAVENLNFISSQFAATGNIDLSAQNTVQLTDTAATPFVADAQGNLTIQGERGITIEALNNPGSRFQSTGDLTLSSRGNVIGNATFASDGTFTIAGSGDLNLSRYVGSSVNFNVSGTIAIGAIDTASGTGDAGPVTLAGRNIVVGSINAFSSAASGNGGVVGLNASGGNVTLGFLNTSAIAGTGGSVDVRAAGSVETGNLITTSINGSAGNVTFNAGGTVRTGDITATSQTGTGGGISFTAVGAIDTTAGRLNTFSTAGPAGNITFNADGTIRTGDITATSQTGTGGGIRFTTVGAIDTTAGTLNASAIAGDGGKVFLDAGGGIVTGIVNTSSQTGMGGAVTANTTGTGGITTRGDINTTSQTGTGGAITFTAVGAIDTTIGTLNSSAINGNGGQVSLGAGGNVATGRIDSTSVDGGGGGITVSSTTGDVDTRAGTLNSSSVSGDGGGVALSANGIANGNIFTAAVNSSSQTRNGGAVTFTAVGAIDTRAGTLNSSSVGGNGGDVALSANGIANGNIFTAAVDSSSQTRNGGAITFTAVGAINATAGTLNSSSVSGDGGGVALSASSNIFTAAVDSSSQSRNGGGITASSTAGGVDTRAGRLNSSSVGGNGGVVELSASGIANGNIFTAIINASSEDRNGGDIRLSSANGSIDTTAGALQSYVTNEDNMGSGGNVTVLAPYDITLASIRSDGGKGSSGAIQVISDRGNISVIPRQQINSSTYGSGPGGDIRLRADNGTVRIEGSYVSATTEDNAIGNGGDIRISGRTIDLIRTDLDASTASDGSGGNIFVEALDNGLITLLSSRISTSVREGASGDGGNVQISGGGITFQNNSIVRAGTRGAGNSGNVSVSATGNSGEIAIDNSTISSDTSGTGSGGNVELSAPFLNLFNFARITARTLGDGQGGSVFVNTDRALTIASNSRISTAVGLSARGDGGDIRITSPIVSLIGGGRLETLTRGSGSAGYISITASDRVDVSGVGALGVYSGLLTSSETGNSGAGGDIRIDTPQLRVADGAFLSTGTRSFAPGGTIIVTVNWLELTRGGQLIASSNGRGDAGDIIVNAAQGVTISGFNPNYTSGNGSNPNPDGIGIGTEQEPNDAIATAQFLDRSLFNLADNPSIEFATSIPHVSVNGSGNDSFDYFAFTVETPDSQGIFDIDNTTNLDTRIFLFDVAGNLLDSNDDAASVAGAQGSSGIRDSYLRYNFSTPGTYVLGIGEFSEEETNNLSGGQSLPLSKPIPTSATYQLNISIETNPIVMPNEGANSGLFAPSSGSGMAGNLVINTPQLALLNGAQASVSNSSTGDAGNLSISSRSISLDNNVKVTAETRLGGGGNIRLQDVRNLRILNNSEISASTIDGRGGTLSISASNRIDLNNFSGLYARSIGNGSAGSLQISASRLTIQNGSQVAVSSSGTGNAGNLNIFANNVLLNNGSRLVADTVDGLGGNIQLFLNRDLTLQNGSEISTSSSGNGNAGRISAQANSLLLTGSRIVSRSSGQGNAGAIDLRLRDRLVSRAGEISASSEGGGGGNITIAARDILLRHSSLISTRVFSGSGGGGNIDITAFAIFKALEDSDILANAEDGNGGRISITAPVFIADLFANVGPNPGKDFSRFRGNGQVDISASSRFGVSGVVSIPDFSFIQSSLSRLSENFVTSDQIVAGSCLARRNGEQGSFTVVGTGGLPNNPYNLIGSRYEVVGVQPVANPGTTIGSQSNAPNYLPLPTPKSWRPGDPIQEAQGLMKTLDGRIILGTDAQLAKIHQAQDIVCGSEAPEVAHNHL